MINIHRLDHHSIKPYLLLTQPGLRRPLLQAEMHPTLLVWGATFWGQPAAIVIAQYADTAARLLDLYVAPACRRAGLGRMLLTQLERELARFGRPHLQTYYEQNEQTIPFAKLLATQGWSTPTHHRTLFYIQLSLGIGQKRWVTKYHFRPPYEAIPWVEVTPAERETIRQRGENGWYPEGLSPFIFPDSQLDPHLSLALRRNGEILGWAMCMRYSAQQCTVPILFVDPPLQRLGRGMMLISEMARRSLQEGIEYYHWGVAPDNEPMLRWTRRAFAETITEEYTEWASHKQLSA